MKNDAEERVRRFYETKGWETVDGVTEDARLWEDLRDCATEYVKKCRLRVLRHIPEHGDAILDMASGPIQYPEYLEYSRNFTKRYCVDLSRKALDEARRKIGERGVYLHGSFFDIQFESDFFDCSISLHTLYHMDKDRQEEAVRKLLRVTKAGQPVIIVYGNPKKFVKRLVSPFKFLHKIRGYFTGPTNEGPGLYYYLHPMDWWNRFEGVADIRMYPWRSFASEHQKFLFPDNRAGKKLFDILYRLEERHPRFFVRYSQYPMIVLRKRIGRTRGPG